MHLIVLHHGLWGNASHLSHLQSRIEQRIDPEAAAVLNLNINSGFKTYQGIDGCGNKVADFLIEKCEELKVTQISFVGYSLGGLVLRFAIGRLFSAGFFDRVEPIEFCTFATPHVGANRPLVSLFNRFFNHAATFFASRSGAQLSLHDRFHHGLPLLVVMADPQSSFHKGLALFKKRRLYANIKNDAMVRYTTSSISLSNPYRKHAYTKRFPDVYPSIVQHKEGLEIKKEPWTWKDLRTLVLLSIFLPIFVPLWFVIASTVLGTATLYYSATHKTINNTWFHETHDSPPKMPHVHKQKPEKTRTWMINSLNLLEWEKFDVDTRSFRAHGAIVVRTRSNMAAADVIEHFVDHLELETN